jgi:GTP-binding protein
MVDQVKILIRAGNGGDGSISFRREKFIPKGGPDGGDGSRGGDVYVETDPNLNTLESFAHSQKFFAENGHSGSGKKMSGSKGEDLIIKVPVGTVMKLKTVSRKDKNSRMELIESRQQQLKDEVDEKMIDFDRPDMKVLVAKGGKGGRGNVHFKSPATTTPMVAEQGQWGDSYVAELELKLLADVGLVGLPNAGKSTLLSVLSNARPKVADYEFTTLEPNLGVLKLGEIHLVIADIPGLIEGASEGRGLGIKFLKHIERTKVLVHLIAAGEESEELFKKYQLVRKELEGYGSEILEKEEIVVLSKIDLVDEERVEEVVNYFKKKKINLLPISAASQKGIAELKLRMERIR